MQVSEYWGETFSKEFLELSASDVLSTLFGVAEIDFLCT
jgi:hypothetical protein